MSIIAAYMVPHPPLAVAEVGLGQEKMIQASLDAYHAIAREIAEWKPETIILTSPHSIMYRDYFHISPGSMAKGDFHRFHAGRVKFQVSYDQELAEQISQLCRQADFPAGTMGERDPDLDHGTMVPLYFIDQYYKDYKLIRSGLAGLSLKDHWEFGRMIRRAVDQTGRRTVFIASGDLSHCQKKDGPYGYRPEGPAYDARIMKVMEAADFPALLDFDEGFLEQAMECGHRSFTIMGGALEEEQRSGRIRARCLAHEATFGVGYGFCSFHIADQQKEGA